MLEKTLHPEQAIIPKPWSEEEEETTDICLVFTILTEKEDATSRSEWNRLNSDF